MPDIQTVPFYMAPRALSVQFRGDRGALRGSRKQDTTMNGLSRQAFPDEMLLSANRRCEQVPDAMVMLQTVMFRAARLDRNMEAKREISTHVTARLSALGIKSLIIEIIKAAMNCL